MSPDLECLKTKLRSDVTILSILSVIQHDRIRVNRNGGTRGHTFLRGRGSAWEQVLRQCTHDNV